MCAPVDPAIGVSVLHIDHDILLEIKLKSSTPQSAFEIAAREETLQYLRHCAVG
jgi:hypothetical protein